jgi:hypothetical protein
MMPAKRARMSAVMTISTLGASLMALPESILISGMKKHRKKQPGSDSSRMVLMSSFRSCSAPQLWKRARNSRFQNQRHNDDIEQIAIIISPFIAIPPGMYLHLVSADFRRRTSTKPVTIRNVPTQSSAKTSPVWVLERSPRKRKISAGGEVTLPDIGMDA